MTRRRILFILKALLLLTLLSLLAIGAWPKWVTSAAPGGGSSSGKFKRAEGSREWRFPRDHGQHPAYRLEWWYYTGIVNTKAGRRFGYQVTFFRQGLRTRRPTDPKASAWTVGSLYLAHAAVSDLKARRFHRADRVGRDSLGLSGAARDRHTVWLGAWRADALAGDPHGARLAITAKPFALRLTLRAEKGPVLHGAGGLDKKGPAPGQASWYYSMPRLATEGTLTVQGKVHQVRGFTWMDHEFGTGQLPPGVAGWDWLALRLDDGSDLMLYRLRRKDGGLAPASAGSLIDPEGKRREIRIADRADGKGFTASMTPGGYWRSPASGGRYPLSWRIAIPAMGLELEVGAAFPAQEQLAAPGMPFAYWEGVVRARGSRAGRPVRGEGYLEMTGYAGPLGGALREGAPKRRP